MNEYEVKQIIEYVNDTSVSDHYGKWGALNREQRKKIRDLCNSWQIINEHDKQMTKIIEMVENMCLSSIKSVDNAINNNDFGENYINDYRIIRLKAFRTKSREILNKIKELKGEK